MKNERDYVGFKAVKPHLKLLARTGCFQLTVDARDGKVSHFRRRQFFGWLLILIYNMQHVIQVYLTRHSVEKMVDILFMQLTNFNTLSKLITFIVRLRRIQRIIDTANDPYFRPKTQAHLDILNANEKKTSKVFFYYMLWVFFGCVAFTVNPIVNKVLDKEISILLYFPFDTSEILGLCAATTYLALTLTFVAYSTVVMDCTVAFFYCQTEAQLKVLRYNIEHFTELDNGVDDGARNVPFMEESMVMNKLLQNRLVYCVNHYREIIRFITEVESIFSVPISINFLILVWVICMTVYKMVGLDPRSSEFISTIVYLGCMLTELFLYCYFGTQLKVESDFVAQSVYFGGWMKLSPQFRRQLIILMSCVSKPIMPCASKIVPISLQTFITVLRASYTLFTIMDKNNNDKIK